MNDYSMAAAADLWGIDAGGAAPFVPTVRGPIAPTALGQTLTHEHLSVDWPYATGRDPAPRETLGVVRRIVACMAAAAAVGVEAIVDVGCNLGPSPLLLLCVAAEAPLHVISSIGAFHTDMAPLPPWVYPPATAEDIGARLVEEALNGPQASGVRPGVIKIATAERAISAVEEAVFFGAAAAQRETGLALTTHTTRTALALEQAEMLIEAGADPGRVVIGHIGWGSGPEDLELHLALAERGFFLGLDMVGLPARSTADYARMALDLIAAGHADRILLSHDNCAHARGLLDVYGPDWLTGDFTAVHAQLLPRLRAEGVPAETLRTILIENPRRLLTVDPDRHPRAAEMLIAPSEPT